MTAINFPDSPSNGDTHVVGGVIYTYDSTETKWKTTINSNAFLPLTGGTVSGNIALDGELQHSGDTDTKLHFDTDTIKFDTAGSERARIDSSGRLLVGTSSAVSADTNALIHIAGPTSGNIVLANETTSLPSNASIGAIRFFSNAGSVYEEHGRIQCSNDGGSGSGDKPGRLAFFTTADGSSSPTERMRITSTGDLRFNSGYGSVATAYGVRAWVNFNGTGAVAIRASGNVSSIADNGTGDYTANFSTSMPDGNYAVAGMCKFTTATNAHFISLGNSSGGSSPSTAACRFRTMFGTAAQDCDIVTIAIFR